MKVTWSGIAIVNATGKLGGTVLQNGRFGSMARIWKKPTNVTLVNFNANGQKNMFRVITSRWRTLSNAQRLSWAPALPTGLSGFNYYTRANLIIFRLTGAFVDTKPIDVAYPTITAITYAIAAFAPIATFGYTAAGTLTNWYFNLFIANNYSAGVSLPRKSEFRLDGNGIVVAGVQTIPFLSTIKGVSPIVGSQCFVKAVLVNKVTGQESAPSYLSATCT